MSGLMTTAQGILATNEALPFSLYSSVKEQRLFNVAITKPLLILVLGGQKKLGKTGEIICAPGSFIFLSNHPTIDMRNIPNSAHYMALLIEFDYEDFESLTFSSIPKQAYVQGVIDPALEKSVSQFMEWSAVAPSELRPMRRREILQLLHLSGYPEVGGLVEAPSLRHQLNAILAEDVLQDLDAPALSSRLAMSESTLRRKLKAEGTNLQTLKDDAKLNLGLHLIQTSMAPIGHIADQCGYHSQARFSERFKQRFGLSPSELRKTRLHESG